MSLKLRKGLLGIIISALTASAALSAGPGESLLRKMKLGDKMPEFSLADPANKVFEYKHGRGRVLLIAFLSAGQKQSRSAVSDIEQIVADARIKAEPFDLVGVMTDPPEQDLKPSFPIVLDSQYKLWGKLGVIAMPTILIVGKDDTISWIKAGHSYDFAPALHTHLNFLLGISGQHEPEERVEVKALSNTTTASRVNRHLQMARILEGKGRFDSAIAEVQKALALDPDSLEPALELGELLCRAGKSEMALKTIGTLQITDRRDNARRLLISGWAKRQMGDHKSAQTDLIEATKLNPKSARAYFELGRSYQAMSDKDNALTAYHRALTLVFGEN